MKTIGLLGGMSWQSTAEYYRLINNVAMNQSGVHCFPPIILYSVDFGSIQEFQSAGRWTNVARELISAAARIEQAGADFLLVCANTAHMVASEIEQSISIPLVHIADAAAEEIQRRGITSVGLLGSRITMEEAFYKGRLAEKYGLRVIIPHSNSRKTVDRIIYQELCRGEISEHSRNNLLQIICELEKEGAQGIILGCTELPLLIKEADTSIPLFDTTSIHARKAVLLALEEAGV